MPRGTLTAYSITRSGRVTPTPTTGDSSQGHQVANDGKTFLLAANTDTSTHHVTFRIQATIDGISVTNSGRQITLTSTQSQYIGPFPRESYNDASDNLLIDVDSNLINLTAFHLG